MTNFFKNFLIRIFNFVNSYLVVGSKTKTPVDFHLEEISKESYNFFKKYFNNANIFVNETSIRNFSINEALYNQKSNSLFIEFGVFKGHTINKFAEILEKKNLNIYGFDSFQGLEEDWITEEYHPVKTFSLNQKKPKIKNNVKLVVGSVQNTLKDFIKNKSDQKIIFVHMDLDTYESTKYVLENIKNRLDKGAIILFDEFYGFPNWKKYEFKAFQEVFAESEYTYIAFSIRQVAVKIN